MAVLYLKVFWALHIVDLKLWFADTFALIWIPVLSGIAGRRRFNAIAPAANVFLHLY